MRLEALLGVLAAAGALLVPGITRAEDLPPLPSPAATSAPSSTIDTVYLRSGGLLRGHVTELLPKDHVTIVVEGGDTKRIAWAEVDHVIVSPVSIPSPPSSPVTPERGAFVHVTSPTPVFLYRRAPDSTAWKQVCSSPCDKELPVSGTYRVTGNGMAAKELTLQASAGEVVEVKVDPSSSLGMVAGGVLMAAGVVAAAISSELEKDTRTATSSGSYTTTRTEEQETSVSNAIGLVGGGLLIGGIVVFLFSMRTSVSSETSKPEPRPLPLDAFHRRPTWRSTSSTERAAAAPAAMFPLVFERTF